MVQKFSKVAAFFARTRLVEVLVLQGSPILGIVLSDYHFKMSGVIRPGLLILGSVLLTAHVFVVNDLIGHRTDIHDPQRKRRIFTECGITQNQVIFVAIAFVILANIAFAEVGAAAVVFGGAITVLSLLYSWSPYFGKGTPVVASINHILGGALHFLLGYTLSHTLDPKGFLISLFFGLVFAAGHLNQEVRDYEGDLLNGIRTNAVVFGRCRTFFASVLTFTAAYGLLAFLAGFGHLPHFLLWIAVLWPLHGMWCWQAFKHGLGFETATWLQRRYRLLFMVIGLAMLAR